MEHFHVGARPIYLDQRTGCLAPKVLVVDQPYLGVRKRPMGPQDYIKVLDHFQCPARVKREKHPNEGGPTLEPAWEIFDLLLTCALGDQHLLIS